MEAAKEGGDDLVCWSGGLRWIWSDDRSVDADPSCVCGALLNPAQDLLIRNKMIDRHKNRALAVKAEVRKPTWVSITPGKIHTEVIRHGEEFVAERADSQHRLDVMFAVAQAYETWWSLSQASQCEPGQTHGCDIYVNSTKYQQGSAYARDKAIAYYEEVLRVAPASILAAYVRLRLPRLKLGIDTNQRRFFCIYD